MIRRARLTEQGALRRFFPPLKNEAAKTISIFSDRFHLNGNLQIRVPGGERFSYS
jgi:hypothetical protein